MRNLETNNIKVNNKLNLRPVEPSPDNSDVLQAEGDVWYDSSDKELKMFNGTETVDIIDSETAWEDLRAPASGINPAGQVSEPSVSADDGSLLFGTSDAVCIWFQLPHSWKQGTDLSPHLHWVKTTSASGTVNWQMKYKWVNIGDTFSTFSELVSGTAVISDSSTAGKHALTAFPDLDGTGKTISSMLCVYLIRTASGDTYGADASLLEFDIHYQIDSLGSEEEYIK